MLDWDLEVWGGDPESDFRGSAGGGFLAEANVGGQLYYSDTQSFFPGERFYTFLDRAGTQFDPTLINGNEHSVRGITSDIVEVAADDGAVGNTVRLSFDANTGADGDGWISAVDNVRLRALAPGDVDGNGTVDPTLLNYLKAGSSAETLMASPGSKATSTPTKSLIRSTWSKCSPSSAANFQPATRQKSAP